MNRCDLKKINYNKVNNNFLLQFQRSVLVLFAQGVLPGGICPRGYMS